MSSAALPKTPNKRYNTRNSKKLDEKKVAKSVPSVKPYDLLSSAIIPTSNDSSKSQAINTDEAKPPVISGDYLKTTTTTSTLKGPNYSSESASDWNYSFQNLTSNSSQNRFTPNLGTHGTSSPVQFNINSGPRYPHQNVLKTETPSAVPLRSNSSVNARSNNIPTQSFAKNDSSHSSTVPANHSATSDLSRLRLTNDYESEDSELDQGERIFPKAPKGVDSSKISTRQHRRFNRNSDDDPSSSSSESSSSSDSSSSSSSSYRSVRDYKRDDRRKPQKIKKRSKYYTDDSDEESSDSSTYSEKSSDHRTSKKTKKTKGFSRSSSRNSDSRSYRDGGAIRYIQTEPREFGELKLERLTVDDAVRFLEKYNNLCSVHNHLVPHISRFIPLSVQQALISARTSHRGKFYKSYDGLYELSTKKVLSMIHHAVIAAEVGNKKQYLEQLKRARFPMDILGKDYQPTASNFKIMRDALAKFQMVFVTRWKFLKEKTPKSFHLSLQKKQHEIGMIQVFTEIIPFGIGKAILENIPLKNIRNCGNNFEQFLREFFDQVEYLMDCYRKAQFLNTIVYSERNREEREARRSKVQMLDDHLDEDSYLELDQQSDDDIDDHVYALAPAGQSSAPGRIIRPQLETEKSPGGCIQLVQFGSCRKTGCKYVHNDPAVLQAT